jgi:hypothetical protein
MGAGGVPSAFSGAAAKRISVSICIALFSEKASWSAFLSAGKEDGSVCAVLPAL